MDLNKIIFEKDQEINKFKKISEDRKIELEKSLEKIRV
jgi:hypothetical protein